ncbi:unnamed protein product [Porites lobata]|uniref:Uncharacterized protein n=1 Tax=Porites lobata TaxID=104759 RepID=A0ABN8QTB2_9CNID|nr:unnamed protein product [Porites lobata]
MNPENKYSKGVGDDNESRQDKKNDQNRYRCRIRHGKIKVFSKGNIVDLTVLKESLLTDRYETMIRVKSNSKRLKRVIDLTRTSHFLINLAVADLLICFTEPATIGTVGIPQRFGHEYYGMNQQHFKLYA